MLQPHPYGLGKIYLRSLPKNPPYFAHITAISYGCLPIRCDETNKLIFPNDDTPREFFATGWEVHAGLELGAIKIIKIHTVIKHTQTKNFSDFVLPLYERRLQASVNGDEDEKFLIKILLNAPYGKFGQNGREFKDWSIQPFGEIPANEPDKHPWEFVADTDNHFTIFSRKSPSDKFYNVATAASITGFARSLLFRSLWSNKKNILYCDTDSIFLTETNSEKFIGQTGTDLGQWKFEGSFSEGYFVDKKMYSLYNSETGEWKSASKGVQLTGEEIKEGALNRSNFTSLKMAPSFSLRFGTRYINREVKFNNVKGNTDEC